MFCWFAAVTPVGKPAELFVVFPRVMASECLGLPQTSRVNTSLKPNEMGMKFNGYFVKAECRILKYPEALNLSAVFFDCITISTSWNKENCKNVPAGIITVLVKPKTPGENFADKLPKWWSTDLRSHYNVVLFLIHFFFKL